MILMISIVIQFRCFIRPYLHKEANLYLPPLWYHSPTPCLHHWLILQHQKIYKKIHLLKTDYFVGLYTNVVTKRHLNF